MKSSFFKVALENNDSDFEGAWIGFDLDGTLAQHDGWKGIDYIGEPIAPMVALLKDYLDKGKTCKIFTARVAQKTPELSEAAIGYIKKWCTINIGVELPVTNVKDPKMVKLYDDRAVGVIENTGKVIRAPQAQ